MDAAWPHKALNAWRSRLKGLSRNQSAWWAATMAFSLVWAGVHESTLIRRAPWIETAAGLLLSVAGCSYVCVRIWRYTQFRQRVSAAPLDLAHQAEAARETARAALTLVRWLSLFQVAAAGALMVPWVQSRSSTTLACVLVFLACGAARWLFEPGELGRVQRAQQVLRNIALTMRARAAVDEPPATARSVEQLQAERGAGPVVFLRPFELANQLAWSLRQPRVPGEHRDRTVISQLEPRLKQALEGAAMIAIGDDGVDGADKILAADADWRRHVAHLCGAARMLLVLPWPTAGVEWELALLVREQRLSRCVFIMPPRIEKHDVQAAWERSASHAARLGLRFPVYAPEGALFALSDAGAVRAVEPFWVHDAEELARALRALTGSEAGAACAAGQPIRCATDLAARWKRFLVMAGVVSAACLAIGGMHWLERLSPMLAGMAGLLAGLALYLLGMTAYLVYRERDMAWTSPQVWQFVGVLLFGMSTGWCRGGSTPRHAPRALSDIDPHWSSRWLVAGLLLTCATAGAWWWLSRRAWSVTFAEEIQVRQLSGKVRTLAWRDVSEVTIEAAYRPRAYRLTTTDGTAIRFRPKRHQDDGLRARFTARAVPLSVPIGSSGEMETEHRASREDWIERLTVGALAAVVFAALLGGRL